MVKILPSILSADFKILKEELIRVEKAGADLIHYDVMDGQFVPNISFGYKILNDISNVVDIEFDVHLMVNEPFYLLEDFKKSGASIITFHYEAVNDVDKYIKEIKRLNCLVGISIKPNTDINVLYEYLEKVDLVLVMSVEPGFGGQKFMDSSLEKIRQLNLLREKNNYNYIIEVDGGVNKDNAHLLKEAGADYLVAGSSVFKKEDYSKAIKELR